MASVTFEHVSKVFDKTPAVNDFSLEIGDGEFMVLVGPSGCGKSTALRMLAGLEEVTKGRILIGDRVVNNVAPASRDIAMVFQSYALYPHMTVYDNLAFGLRNTGVPKREIDDRVRRAAEILQMDELVKRKPKQLSGGQRQRVALGRAIVREPKAFLMDEPLSNLDAKLRVETRAEILKLQDRLDTTTIYVTHDQIEAMTMGDRIAVMNAGVLQQVGTPEEVYTNPRNVFVAGFIGSPAMNLVPAPLARRRRAGPHRGLPAGAPAARAGRRGRLSLRRADRGRRVPRRRAARSPHPEGHAAAREAARRAADRDGTRRAVRRRARQGRPLRRGDARARRVGCGRDRAPLRHAHPAVAGHAAGDRERGRRGRAEARGPDRARARVARRRAARPRGVGLPPDGDDGQPDRDPDPHRARRRRDRRGALAPLHRRAGWAGRPLGAVHAPVARLRGTARAGADPRRDDRPALGARAGDEARLAREHAQLVRRADLAARRARRGGRDLA